GVARRFHVQSTAVVESDGGSAASGSAGNDIARNGECAAVIDDDITSAASWVRGGSSCLLHGHGDVASHDHQCGTDAQVIVYCQDAMADAAADERTGNLNSHFDRICVNRATAENKSAIAIASSVHAIKLPLTAAEYDVVYERVNFGTG